MLTEDKVLGQAVATAISKVPGSLPNADWTEPTWAESNVVRETWLGTNFVEKGATKKTVAKLLEMFEGLQQKSITTN